MGHKISKCKQCSRYTLEISCPYCGGKTVNPNPARFSPADRYGKYRRQSKQIEDTT
ncbi:MAG: RNA-protein complex protein Nop10 [Methanohalobium sp.]|uniref:RNA-protein complex protein Nop10 n=1 Tax=Methanohalobium sp. TaxID=2837493 RepID=UPI0039786DE0